MKNFAAITAGGYVLFAFKAANSEEARALVARSLRKRSDTIEKIRLLRDDMSGPMGAPIEWR